VYVWQLFNEYLSLEDRTELHPASQGGADDDYEKKVTEQITLWRSVSLKHFNTFCDKTLCLLRHVKPRM